MVDPAGRPAVAFPVPLDAKREQTIVVLCSHFADDTLTMAELEQRLDRAYRATNVAELSALLTDLPTRGSESLGDINREANTIPRARARERQTVAAVMGSTIRRGVWEPSPRLMVLACMGNVRLDFREAIIVESGLELNILAAMGGIEIIVPPGAIVRPEVLPIMGGIEDRSASSGRAAEKGPVLYLRGAVVMGGIQILERLPGESGRDARRRIRAEQRRRRTGREE